MRSKIPPVLPTGFVVSVKRKHRVRVGRGEIMHICLTCMEKSDQNDFCSMGCYLEAPQSVKELIWKQDRRV